ncbi:aftiphilin a isoform X2 [Hemibagrus wyckioides]|uniref:aftiphilin a isoform X2 n=1 Tax=Hemibagrus wyckioides TaxID=337641 RepID=UPI00266B7392|nr:aftiphilin a isoform X2 [Hemibagrus wyckioides]
MEPDVIHMYSSSPPPLEDGADEDDEEFSDFTGVPNSVSFTEFETPTTFGQLQALNATSPPELIGNGRVVGLNRPAMPNGGQGDALACRTVSVEELKKVTEHPHGTYTNFSDFPGNSWTGSDAVDCNGRGSEVLTNGFANFGTEGTPPSHHIHREMAPSGGRCPDAVLSDEEDFADFAAFSNADVPSQPVVNWESSNHNVRLAQDNQPRREENHEAGKAVDNDKDYCVTGFASFAEASDHLSNGVGGFHVGTSYGQRDQDTEPAHQDSNTTTESVSTGRRTSQNSVEQDGLEVKERMDNRVSPVSMDERGSSSEPTEEKGSGNDTETETETETSFGRPLSTEALEEFGDFSTTGSVPSPPLQEETATPADHSQLAEDDDEDFGDFGDFGDASSFGGAGFADFDQQGAAPQSAPSESIAPSQSVRQNDPRADEDEFGDFDVHGQPGKTAQEGEEGAETAEFPGSDSFADFAAAPVDGNADDNGGWQAFGGSSEEGGVSWAAFGQDQGSTFSEKSEDDWHESPPVTAPPTGSDEECRKNSTVVSLLSRLEKLFLASFLEISMPHLEEDVPPLKAFLEPCERGEKQKKDPVPVSGGVQGVWLQLQDIHNAFGLRYQWGGSHSNKTLLCSLGIDTRNILFTGQKKQPVIVPMYAASLGMLEPTKEPVKPVSAAEMIASIAQSPSVASEMSSCSTDAAQESLPPVQFDWSSSGLTNPLDGVDPELYELTQAKLDVSGGSNRVVDAFARLMSTVEKTNTSTRRVQTQKEENLSEEARRVISTLPDLSFMQAKVLMFPSTLTPLPPSSSSSISPSPVPD